MILSRELGDWHAIRGEWEQARNCFPQRPEDGNAYDYFLRALTALKVGDEAGFLRARNPSISRFKGTTDAGNAECVMQAGLLRPVDNTSAAALEPYAQVLERAVAGAGQLKEGTATPAAFHLTLLGLFAYRRGDYAEALEDCQRSLVASTYLPMPSATDRVIRAMSFHKLGDDASARSELDGARSVVQSGLNIGYDRWNWPEWVFVRLLLQEADGMIPQAPHPEPQK
jgi:tetratricopeptide (TPR) repeat protein